MTTIDAISQVLTEHASNTIDEGEALRRVHEITCAQARHPHAICILIDLAKSEIERHRATVRSHVERLVLDVRDLAADLEARGPDTLSTAWVGMHVTGLLEAHAQLKAERERLREFQQLLAT